MNSEPTQSYFNPNFWNKKNNLDDISHDLKMIQNIHKIFKKPEAEFKEVESRR